MPASDPKDQYVSGSYFAARLPYDRSRDSLWRILCKHLQAHIPDNSRILELGGGYCGFINHIAGAEKHVVDLFPDLSRYAAPEVTAHVQSCSDLANFEPASLSCVFASNLFEHLTRDELSQTLRECRRTMRSGATLIVIQPNFKYSYASYFDDYTHLQIFTEKSLSDLLSIHGFTPTIVIPRFLPFSLNSRAPKWPWLLEVYLRLPWRPMAGQMLVVAKKP